MVQYGSRIFWSVASFPTLLPAVIVGDVGHTAKACTNLATNNSTEHHHWVILIATLKGGVFFLMQRTTVKECARNRKVIQASCPAYYCDHI